MTCASSARSLAESTLSRPSGAPSTGPFALVGSSRAPKAGGGEPLSGVLLRRAARCVEIQLFLLRLGLLALPLLLALLLQLSFLAPLLLFELLFVSARGALHPAVSVLRFSSAPQLFCSSAFFCSSAGAPAPSGVRRASSARRAPARAATAAGGGGGGGMEATSFLGSSFGSSLGARRRFWRRGRRWRDGDRSRLRRLLLGGLRLRCLFGLRVRVCLALRAPCRSRVSSLALTRSTAMGSGSGMRSSRCAWMVKRAHARIAACRTTEVASPPRTVAPSLTTATSLPFP